MKKRTTCLSYVLLLCALLFCACSGPAGSQSETRSPTWQEQYDLGVRYLSEGNYEEAIIAFTAAIEIDPKRAEAYVGLADVYLAMDDFDKVVQVLQDGLTATGNADLQTRLNELIEMESEPLPVPEENSNYYGPTESVIIPLNYTVLESENNIEQFLEPIYRVDVYDGQCKSYSKHSRGSVSTILYGRMSVQCQPAIDGQPYMVMLDLDTDLNSLHESLSKRYPTQYADSEFASKAMENMKVASYDELFDKLNVQNFINGGGTTKFIDEINWFSAVICYDSSGNRIGYVVFEISADSVQQVKDTCMVTVNTDISALT